MSRKTAEYKSAKLANLAYLDSLRGVTRRTPKKRKHKQKTPNSDRGSLAYRQWRMKVLKRDGFQCLRCHSKQHLQAHHCMVDYARNPARQLDVNNGATLCAFCHAYEHPWMVKHLEQQFDPDLVAFEMAQREDAWGPMKAVTPKRRVR